MGGDIYNRPTLLSRVPRKVTRCRTSQPPCREGPFMLTTEVFSHPLREVLTSFNLSSRGSHSDNVLRCSDTRTPNAIIWAIEVLICDDESVRRGRYMSKDSTLGFRRVSNIHNIVVSSYLEKIVQTILNPASDFGLRRLQPPL